ncbi:MAG: DUF4263 domain-containing protein [Gemmatimonadetes bacterium]|nr:DUF4263 domain-containing protein [Gemmatimonadota bacterium]
MAALQGIGSEYWGFEDYGYVIEADSVFRALLSASPSILIALHNAGVDTTKLASSFGSPGNRSLAPLAPNTLETIFEGTDDQQKFGLQIHADQRLIPAKVEEDVGRNRRLTEVDLFRAFLTTAYVGPVVAREAFDSEDLRACLSYVGELLVNSGFAEHLELNEWLDDDGDYRATINIGEEFAKLVSDLSSLELLDPSHYLTQFALYLDSKGRVRIRPFGVVATGVHGPHFLDEDSVYRFRSNILQPVKSLRTSITEESIEELEHLVNSDKFPESEFQRFFEVHPDFLLGQSYQAIHPQLVLSSQENRELIPDFFLEPLESRFCDLLELKIPYQKLVTRLQNSRRTRFRAFVNEAAAQLKEYQKFFDERGQRTQFHKKYGLEAYKPKMFLVAGRTHHFDSDVERKELNQLLPRDLELWTYDDLLLRAKRYVEFVQSVG